MKPINGSTNPANVKNGIQRFGSVIGLKPETEQLYRELHAEVWPTVIERLAASNIQNYSIYVADLDGNKYLFSYFEYTGSDIDIDLAAMAADPETQRWWNETDPCQRKLPNREPGATWTWLERVFFTH